jgi:hypothetical protein
MAEVTFSETLDWLDEHQGQRVVVEVGCKDPRTDNADFAVLQVHTMLGAMRIVDDPARSRQSRLRRHPRKGSWSRRDQACFHGAKIHLGLLKVWQHDVYVVLSPIWV